MFPAIQDWDADAEKAVERLDPQNEGGHWLEEETQVSQENDEKGPVERQSAEPQQQEGGWNERVQHHCGESRPN